MARHAEFVPRTQRCRRQSQPASNRIAKKIKMRERYIDYLDGNPRAAGEQR